MKKLLGLIAVFLGIGLIISATNSGAENEMLFWGKAVTGFVLMLSGFLNKD